MVWEVWHAYPPEPMSSRLARRFCADQLVAAFGTAIIAVDVFDAASLIVSELITNAINAGSSEIRLSLSVGDAALRISVIDDAQGTPSERNPGADEVHGRGLAIVDSLSSAWGVTMLEDSKRVWADVPIPAHLEIVPG